MTFLLILCRGCLLLINWSIGKFYKQEYQDLRGACYRKVIDFIVILV